MRRPNFSMNEFKDWLSKQEDMKKFFDLNEEEEVRVAKPKNKFLGKEVVAKMSRNKLEETIEPQEADADIDQLLDELMETGGVITGINGRNLVIEVESGTFQMPRFCVKIVVDE